MTNFLFYFLNAPGIWSYGPYWPTHCCLWNVLPVHNQTTLLSPTPISLPHFNVLVLHWSTVKSTAFMGSLPAEESISGVHWKKERLNKFRKIPSSSEALCVWLKISRCNQRLSHRLLYYGKVKFLRLMTMMINARGDVSVVLVCLTLNGTFYL